MVGLVLLCTVLLTVSCNVDWETGSIDDLLEEDQLTLYVFKENPRHKRQAEDIFEGSGDEPPSDENADFDKATFTFSTEFRIEMTLEEFINSSNHREQFTQLLTESFKNVSGFKDVRIVDIRTGSVIATIEAELRAKEANEAPKLGEELFDGCLAVFNDNTFNIANNITGWNRSANNAELKSRDLCKAQGIGCPWYSELNCTNGNAACPHLCKHENCGDRGTCSLTGDRNGATTVCKCQSDDHYDYYGDKCENRQLRWEMVLAISGGIGGALIVIISLVLVVVCCRRKNKSSADVSRESDVSEGVRTPGFYSGFATQRSSGRFGRPLFKPSFYSELSLPGSHQGHKLFPPSVQDSYEDIYPDFTPNLQNIDTDKIYRIARPKLNL